MCTNTMKHVTAERKPARGEDTRLNLSAPEVGCILNGAACLVENTPGITRTGSPYASVALRNRTGEIRSRVWSDKLDLVSDVPAGAAVHLEGIVKEGFNGGPPELEIRTLRVLPDTHSVRREVNPVCPENLKYLRTRFAALVARLGTPDRALLDVVLDGVGRQRYEEAPAATPGNHHGYLHGLLEHSLEVAEVALSLREHLDRYDLDQGMLVVGALLHDIGKVGEYDWEGPIRLSEKGRLSYHTASGQVLIDRAVQGSKESLSEAGVTERQIECVLHVVESHHGKKEYGSPKECCLMEAVVIHYADELSAKLRQMADAIEGGAPEPGGWVRAQHWPFKNRHLLASIRA